MSLIRTEVHDGTLEIRIEAGWLDKIGQALRSSLTKRRLRYTLSLRDLASQALGVGPQARARGLGGVGHGEARLGDLGGRHFPRRARECWCAWSLPGGRPGPSRRGTA